ncbi:MAG: hypothetical protein J6A69_01215 [Clostridia bacterium]|nr:hypothetical protein [Clostridia bacterium]
MISTALSSKALKELDTTKITELCVYSHIHKIEWDSSHVPYEDLDFATEVEKHCRQNSLLPISYNTNLTVTSDRDISDLFEKVCMCATTLRAPSVNITVGNCPADKMTKDEYLTLVNKTNALCKLAKNIIVNLLPEKNSVASDTVSALNFLADVHMTNLKLYWSSDPLLTEDENKKNIELAVRYTTNVYISNTTKEGDILPVLDVKQAWRNYGSSIASDRSRLHLFILDKLPDSNAELLNREFTSLRRILTKIR